MIGSGAGELIDEDTGELTTKVVELIKSLIVIVAGQHIIIDHLPTQAEISLYPVGAVILVYNPNNPYVPLS